MVKRRTSKVFRYQFACSCGLSLSLSLSLSAFPLICGVVFYVSGYFSTPSFYNFLSTSPHTLQKPQSIFEGAHLLGFNEFPSLECWGSVIHHHRSQWPTLFRRVRWDFTCVPYPRGLQQNECREWELNLCPSASTRSQVPTHYPQATAPDAFIINTQKSALKYIFRMF